MTTKYILIADGSANFRTPRLEINLDGKDGEQAVEHAKRIVETIGRAGYYEFVVIESGSFYCNLRVNRLGSIVLTDKSNQERILK